MKLENINKVLEIKIQIECLQSRLDRIDENNTTTIYNQLSSETIEAIKNEARDNVFEEIDNLKKQLEFL